MAVHYYQSEHPYHSPKTHKRLKWFSRGLLIGIPIIIPILFFTTSVFVKPAQTPAKSNVQTSVVASSIKVFRSPFFQFQAGKTWDEVANESTTTKFVYRKFNSTLVEGQLDIYVNEAADQNIKATHLLPVTYSEDGGKLKATFVSEACAKNTQQTKGYVTMSLLGVTFRCFTEATDYNVLVGKEGGSTRLEMIRPNSSPVSYVIHFRDLRAIPDAQDVEDIVNSFQTR